MATVLEMIQSAQLMQAIGRRDAVAELLANIRADGLSAVEDAARRLFKQCPGHPHAKWILENPEWKTK